MKKIKSGAATDSLFLTLTRVLTASISVIIYKLLTVHFSLDEYGTYSQVLLVSTTLVAITDLGMTDAINYFFNRDGGKERGRLYVNTIFALQIIIGLVGAVCVLLLKNQIAFYFDNSAVKSLLIYVAFVPLLTNLFNMLQVLFVSYRKAKIVAIRNFLFSIFKILFVIAACFIFRSIKYVLIGSLIMDVITVWYMLHYSKKNMFPVSIVKVDFSFAKEIFYYSIPMAAFIITNSLSRNMDKLVIGWLGNTRELALYAVAAKELPLDMLTSSFMTVLIPYITRYIAAKDFNNAAETFSKYIQMSYAINWIIAVGVLAASKEFMLILYDQKYISALLIFNLYIVVDMFRFANTSIIFAANGRTKELILYSGSALVLNLIFNVIFYRSFGIVGPAISTVFVTLMLSGAMLIRSAKMLNAKITYLINYKYMIMLVAECAAFASISYFIKARFFAELPILVSFVLTYIIYAVPLLLLNYKKIITLLKSINKLKISSF